jgi:ATP-dependent RNA helicase DeaD
MTLSFSSLGLSETRVSHLESLGYHEPSAIQAEAIPHLLSGRDLIGQAQTGTGKTAALLPTHSWSRLTKTTGQCRPWC